MAEPVPIRSLELLERLRDPSGALEGIGAILAASGQEAFTQKRFGTFRWPTRYPKQSEPFINIAAALSDLHRGRPIRPQRFKREPVLRDTSTLFRSISWRVASRDTIEVGVFDGPALKYASTHNRGGESVVPVTKRSKDLLRDELGRAKGAKRAALEKLAFILRPSVTQYRQRVHKRPFIGITDQAARDIVEHVVDWGEAELRS